MFYDFNHCCKHNLYCGPQDHDVFLFLFIHVKKNRTLILFYKMLIVNGWTVKDVYISYSKLHAICVLDCDLPTNVQCVSLT